MTQQRVLILCTGNSARSQMAEGLLRALGGDQVVVASAGSRPSTVHPLAIRAMDECGINLRGQHSKHLEIFIGQSFDHVITVCDQAAQACPAFPGPARRWHWSLPDPAAATGSEEAQLQAFRNVREELAGRLRAFLAEIAGSSCG